MARQLVPELEDYQDYALLETIANNRRLTHEQAFQLAYNNAMTTLVYLHHRARYVHEMNALNQRQQPQA